MTDGMMAGLGRSEVVAARLKHLLTQCQVSPGVWADRMLKAGACCNATSFAPNLAGAAQTASRCACREEVANPSVAPLHKKDRLQEYLHEPG